MLRDPGIDRLPAMRLEPFERPFPVGAHQTRIARHIGGEDRGKTAGEAIAPAAHPVSGYQRWYYRALL